MPTAEKIKVNILGNYPGDSQLSMLAYAKHLEAALISGFPETCEILKVSPAEGETAASLRRFPLLKKAVSYWKRFVSYPLLARNVPYGLNHITDHNNSYLINYLKPSRTVVTCHDIVYFRVPEKGGEWNSFSPRYALRRYILSGLVKAARVICDSENTKKDVVELLGVPAERIDVVYPGIKSCFKKISDPEELRLGKDRFGLNCSKTILHVGESCYYKNVEAIICSMGLSRGLEGEPPHFLKVGKDFTKEQKKLINRHGLSERVHYLGALNDEDLNLIYNLADVLVFPSLYEGFGWPPLEAMSCGTPVICSDKGSLKEIVGDAAIIVGPDDYEGIAEAVSRVLSDPALREEKIRKGFENVLRFSWQKAASSIFAVYRKVMENA